jgi:hypothetical protein
MANTGAQGFPYPLPSDDPNIPDDLMQLAKAIEKRVMGVYPSPAERNAWTAAVGIEEGMFAYTRSDDMVCVYNGSSWVQFPTPTPKITSSGSVPSNATGTDGDVHFKV